MTTLNIDLTDKEIEKLKAYANFNNTSISEIIKNAMTEFLYNIPNQETLKAMEEAEEILKGNIERPVYNSSKELFTALNSDNDD